MINENNKIDSDPMRLFVLLPYETSIRSESNLLTNTSVSDLVQHDLE